MVLRLRRGTVQSVGNTLIVCHLLFLYTRGVQLGMGEGEGQGCHSSGIKFLVKIEFSSSSAIGLMLATVAGSEKNNS